MNMNDEAKALFDILYDPAARIDERDDAAMYLSQYKTKDVLDGLTALASNSGENELVLASLGESIGEIMIVNNKFEIDVINKLHPIAKQEALGIIQGKKPEWIK